MRGVISTIDGKPTLTINFIDADPIGSNFGNNDDICNVNDVIGAVRDLYREEIVIEGYDFPLPTNEQIRVDYVTSPISAINITWANNVGNGLYNVIALNQQNESNVFITYPISNNCMNAQQILSHELGHWFLNRAIENRISAADLRRSRHDIDGYEDVISEKAALYCEIKIAGYRKVECYSYENCKMVCEIKRAITMHDRCLRLSMSECLRKLNDQH